MYFRVSLIALKPWSWLNHIPMKANKCLDFHYHSKGTSSRNERIIDMITLDHISHNVRYWMFLNMFTFFRLERIWRKQHGSDLFIWIQIRYRLFKSFLRVCVQALEEWASRINKTFKINKGTFSSALKRDHMRTTSWMPFEG